MARRIKITGVKELKSALQGNVLRFPNEVNQIVAKHGANLQTTTMNNMDRAYTGHWEWKKGKGRVFVKPTGATKRSVTLRKSNFKAEVQTRTKYFPYLEYGTRFMARRPTLGPAFSKIEPQFRGDLEKLFK